MDEQIEITKNCALLSYEKRKNGCFLERFGDQMSQSQKVGHEQLTEQSNQLLETNLDKLVQSDLPVEQIRGVVAADLNERVPRLCSMCGKPEKCAVELTNWLVSVVEYDRAR